ncbi:MAG: hypothetical protein Q7R83_00550 [bacterium]|nr:hypothetical protein [bacterium]
MPQRYMIVSGPSKEWLKAVLFEAPLEQCHILFMVRVWPMGREPEEKVSHQQIFLKTVGYEDGDPDRFVVTGADQFGHEAVAHFMIEPPPPCNEIDSGQEYSIGDLEVE